MIEDKRKIISYLNSTVNSVFKILPLYEEKNIGVKTYIESLLFDLDSYEDVVKHNQNAEYVQLMLALNSLKKEVARENSQRSIVKREVFKCINVIKNMISKLEEGA
jgi:hypothetical protein